MRTVVVTGASGYLGTNVVRALEQARWQVRAFDIAEPIPPASPPTSKGSPAPTWIRGSVLDPDALALALDGAEAVVHLAAGITLRRRDRTAWILNTAGPGIVARAARAQGIRMVHCSSIHALDTSIGAVVTEDTPPAGPDRPLYDRSKAAGQRAVLRQVAKGLDAVICQPTGVIGPSDHTSSRVNRLIVDAARGRLPAVISGGFDWVDVRDVAHGITCALERGQPGRSYLMPGTRASVNTLTQIAAALAGRHRPRGVIPLELVDWLTPLGEVIGGWVGSDVFTAASLTALGEVPHVSSLRARTDLGYSTRSLAATIYDLLIDHSVTVTSDPGELVAMRRDTNPDASFDLL